MQLKYENPVYTLHCHLLQYIAYAHKHRNRTLYTNEMCMKETIMMMRFN